MWEWFTSLPWGLIGIGVWTICMIVLGYLWFTLDLDLDEPDDESRKRNNTLATLISMLGSGS